MRISTLAAGLLPVLVSIVFCGTGSAAELNADPSNYRALLSKLQPGNTLRLAAGKYSHLPVMKWTPPP